MEVCSFDVAQGSNYSINVNEMRLLFRASEQHEDFYDLIGTEVTFANNIINISGEMMYSKGEKAFISDVSYCSGYWHRFGHYEKPLILGIYINGIVESSWNQRAFEELKLIKQP